MEVTIDLSKFNDDQLVAFEAFDKKAVEAEREYRLNNSTYVGNHVQIYTDLEMIYKILKPMYDNMRNNDVKKLITSSQLFPILEKVFRTAKAQKVDYKHWEPETETAEETAPVVETETAPVAPVAPVAPIEEPSIPVPPTLAPENVIPVMPAPTQPVAPVLPPIPELPQMNVETMSVEEINNVMNTIPLVQA